MHHNISDGLVIQIHIKVSYLLASTFFNSSLRVLLELTGVCKSRDAIILQLLAKILILIVIIPTLLP